MVDIDTCFKKTRELFYLPPDIIYLDGNSLGPLPIAVAPAISSAVEQEWGNQLIQAWNNAGWMSQPTILGDRIGKLIGASPGSVVVGDTLSIKIYQALSAALSLQPQRRVVVSDASNFPTDLYMAEGLLRQLGDGYELRLVEPGGVGAALDKSVAALMLTHVDYRSGRMYDMQHLTALAHEHNTPVVWDLAHSAGAVPVDLVKCQADFAAGCTYKYLNGGPGAPAFIYIADKWQQQIQPVLSGWLGHSEPFAFELGYEPGKGIERMRIGTPSVLASSALGAALDVWDGVSMADVRAQSIVLSELFIHELETRCPMLTLASPRDPEQRGSQVSFSFEHGYAAIQALIQQHRVIGDFRAPDIMRFAFTPLYLSVDDVLRAVAAIEAVMTQRQWDDPSLVMQATVT